MKSWVLAASLLAAVLTTGAKAADLDDGLPPPDRRGAYDDPRYGDIYRHAVPPPPPYAAPPPRGPAYRGEYEDYGPPRRHAYADPRCLPREEIRHRLISQGWQDFHAPDVQGELATLQARRPSGRLFALTVDRCSGEIVSARPLEPRPYGPYADGPRQHAPYAYGSRYEGPYAYGPRRWDRPYY